jgi:GNAT superfamily N-acetyltransferase
MRRYIITPEQPDDTTIDRFVRRGLVSGREGWRAVGRYLFSGYFLLTAVLPAGGLILLVVTARFFIGTNPLVNLCLAGGPFLLWLVFQVVRRGRAGRVVCLGCRTDGDGPGRLVGGMRLLLNEKRRRVLIAGLYVDPAHRRRGILSALLLGLFRWLARQPGLSDCRIRMLAPVHPASRQIRKRYFSAGKGNSRAATADLSQRLIAKKTDGNDFDFTI